MPKFDKTGPRGLGPKTGKGLGPCNGFASYIMSRGGGFGRFWRFGTEITPKEEKQILEEEIAVLQEELQACQSRLKKLNKK